jgi:hypothetical protein
MRYASGKLDPQHALDPVAKKAAMRVISCCSHDRSWQQRTRS